MKCALLDQDRVITNTIEVEPEVASEFDAHYLGDTPLGIGDRYPASEIVQAATTTAAPTVSV